MKKYVVMMQNKATGTLTDNLLQKHVAHLKLLHQAGNLFLCGPFKGNDGAMKILFAESLEHARSLASEDPFIQGQYYRSQSIYELEEANEANNYLLSQ